MLILLKTVYNKLFTKVYNTDTTVFVLKKAWHG